MNLPRCLKGQWSVSFLPRLAASPSAKAIHAYTMNLLVSDSPEKTIVLPTHIEIRELAALLHVKPFKVVADLMELKQFKHMDEKVDLPTATAIVQKHGYIATPSARGQPSGDSMSSVLIR